MRQSVMSVIFAAALLFECYALSVALPMGNTEDGPMENEVFTSFLSDHAMESGLGDADLATVTKTRVPKLIVIAADPSLWRDLRVLHNGLPIYKRTADDSNQLTDHRDDGQQLSFPILRRDTMRCMVGRVYRPCWEA